MAKRQYLFSDFRHNVTKGQSGEDLYYKKLQKSLEDSDSDRILFKAKKRVEKAQSIRQVPHPEANTPQKDRMLKSAESLENVLKEMNHNPVVFENDFKEFKIKLAKSIDVLPLGNAMQIAIMKARITNSVSMYDLKNQIYAIAKSLRQLPDLGTQYSNLMSREKS